MRPHLGRLVLVVATALVALVLPRSAGASTRVGCSGSSLRTVKVGDPASLARALSRARAGDRILLADGRYVGNFALKASGTADHRIQVCGTHAVLDGGSTKSNFGFTLT